MYSLLICFKQGSTVRCEIFDCIGLGEYKSDIHHSCARSHRCVSGANLFDAWRIQIWDQELVRMWSMLRNGRDRLQSQQAAVWNGSTYNPEQATVHTAWHTDSHTHTQAFQTVVFYAGYKYTNSSKMKERCHDRLCHLSSCCCVWRFCCSTSHACACLFLCIVLPLVVGVRRPRYAAFFFGWSISRCCSVFVFLYYGINGFEHPDQR